MKTVLVLSSLPDFAAVVRSSLPDDQFRIIHRISVEEAEPFRRNGSVRLGGVTRVVTAATGRNT
jgi:hypothetical protein